MILAAVGVVVLLAGCDGKADSAAESAAPTPTTTTPPPKPVGVQELDGLLLTADGFNELMGASDMEVSDTGSNLIEYSNMEPEDCLSLDDVVQRHLYEGSGWIAARWVAAREDADPWQHFLRQAVVNFPATGNARQLFDEAVKQWSACAGEGAYTWTRKNGTTVYWTVDPVNNADGMLTNSRLMEGGEGWGCQRALTVKNNVVVDVVACMVDARNQGELIAQEIATKIP